MRLVVMFLFPLILIAAAVYLSFLNVPVYTYGVNITSFLSEDDFKSYLALSESYFGTYSSYIGSSSVLASTRSLGVPGAPGAMVPGYYDFGTTSEAEEPTRVSETNVQVTGIDEPDIVKTDGREIYFSSQGFRNYWWTLDFNYPYYVSGETNFIKAFPPGNMTVDYRSDKTGDLLLYNNTLIVISYDYLYGYDVSDPTSPELSWTIRLNSSITSMRLYNGKIYMITRSRINDYYPCPVPLMSVNGIGITVPCSRIYHPVYPTQVDYTYNAVVINPVSGAVENSVSFVGSSYSSVVYMSTDAIYVTYPIYQDPFTIYYNLIKEKFTGLFPLDVIQRVDRVAGYDISYQAKLVELQVIITEYMSKLQSENLTAYDAFVDEYENRTAQYFIEHKRDFDRTGIAKIGLDMDMLGSVSFPGEPLNQFSLDEYNGYLRIATTVTGTGSWSWSDWANDIYIFDSDLNLVGSVIDMGLEERIYSARFVGDMGYLVTFRQTDPFFVLDLSDPANPELKGELEIPGYSSYLHPIGEDRMLGVGKEGSYVKISLFDVSSPENPQELARYGMDEYWSDILNTHHAFLLDEQHGIFFLPGGGSGYIFSYVNDTVSLVKEVRDVGAKRAVYINDYLYIIGEYEIVVLDENTWEEVSSLTISQVI